MTSEQLERRLRALELSTRGADYVAKRDEIDAAEDAEKAAAEAAKKSAHSEDTSA